MADFDVTDSYNVEANEQGEVSLILKSGTTIHAKLTSDADGTTHYVFKATDVDGNDVLAAEDKCEKYDYAVSRVHTLARQVINDEEPLGQAVNWANSELMNLLVDQNRIMLCPNCMGEHPEGCPTCGGNTWTPCEVAFAWIDALD
jgi:hypothetical protein